MKSLDVRPPFGWSLVSVALVFGAICLVGELLGRMPMTATRLPLESYGSSHPQFNTQVARIRGRVRESPNFDCIFLGSSQVLYGIDPGTLERILEEKFNRPFRCQNFGLGGLTPATAASLSKLLIDRFHPTLLVYATSELDYIATSFGAADASILSTPWYEYQMGTITLDGWLLEHSYAYRYYLGTVDYYFNHVGNDPDIQADGHSIRYAAVSTMSLPRQVRYFDQLYSRAIIRPQAVEGLRRLLGQDTPASAVAVLEMPTDPVYFSLKPQLNELHPTFERMLRDEADASGVNLWLTQTTLHLPPESWYDLVHLNGPGSRTFSTIVADYLGNLYPSPWK